MDLSKELILKDFDTFLDFLNEQAPLELTKDKGVLKGKYLLPLNEKMKSFQTMLASNKHKQDVFTLINTFFFIAEKVQIVLKKTGKKDEKMLHLNVERAKLYDALSENEKYIFLLDAFLHYIDWRRVYDSSPFWGHKFYIELLTKFSIGKKVTIKDTRLKREGQIDHCYYIFVAEMMHASGLITLEWDDSLQKRGSMDIFPYKAVTVTPLGATLLPTIFQDKRKSLNDIEEEEMEDERATWFKGIQTKFTELDIQKSLFPLQYEPISGTYHFKVMLDKKCYRVIAIGGGATFEEFHGAIQTAFDFEDDHLYVFYLDGNEYSDDEDNRILAAYCNDGMFYGNESTYADEVKIGERGLFEGKNFMYLFDFGANWRFSVTLEKIFPSETEPTEATIIQSVGENPEQYEEWDWDEDEEDE